jgi:hypothetical protein
MVRGAWCAVRRMVRGAARGAWCAVRRRQRVRRT